VHDSRATEELTVTPHNCVGTGAQLAGSKWDSEYANIAMAHNVYQVGCRLHCCTPCLALPHKSSRSTARPPVTWARRCRWRRGCSAW
jgi:hypothetical protein